MSPNVTPPASHAEMAAAFNAQANYCASRRDTAYAAFHGCIDWHSAVHSAWAQTAYYRAHPSPAALAGAERDLTPDNIREEYALLVKRPDFETPYGRSWFLRLVVERKRAGLDGRLDEMADIVARGFIDHYAIDPATPEAHDYNSDTWALVNLFDYGRAMGDERIVRFVEAQVRASFMVKGAHCDADDDEGDGFLAACATWAWLMSDVLSTPELRAWVETWSPDYAATPPVQAPSSAHLYGMNFSRAWGLAALYRNTGDEKYRAAYCRHLEQGYADWRAERADYGAVGHWVAQFGMLALQQAQDAPDWCVAPTQR